MRYRARYSALLCLALSWAEPASSGQLRLATDLNQTGTLCETRGIPIVLFFSTADCEYCEAVRTEFLNHVTTDTDETERALLREIRLDSADQLVGFDRQQTTHAGFADRRGIVLVPTIQFTDGRGTELEDQIVGLGTLEFYGAYLDRGIDRALDKLRNQIKD
jgi:hypothetical protein